MPEIKLDENKKVSPKCKARVDITANKDWSEWHYTVEDWRYNNYLGTIVAKVSEGVIRGFWNRSDVEKNHPHFEADYNNKKFYVFKY